MLRIGLDIDDCLAEFMLAYKKYFNTNNNPKLLENLTITKNVFQVLRKDRDFWLGLELINYPDFIPELYCTKRVNNKLWTKQWLLNNNLPKAPVYQMYLQSGNKADMIKGKVDIFIDDSISNMIKMNLSGVPCLLLDKEYNRDFGPIGRIYTLNKEEILDIYHLFMNTIYPYFNDYIRAYYR